MAIQQLMEEGVNPDNLRTFHASHEGGETGDEITFAIRDEYGNGEPIRVSASALHDAFQPFDEAHPIIGLPGRFRTEKLIDFSLDPNVAVWIRTVAARPNKGYFLHVTIQDLRAELAPFGIDVPDRRPR